MVVRADEEISRPKSSVPIPSSGLPTAAFDGRTQKFKRVNGASTKFMLTGDISAAVSIVGSSRTIETNVTPRGATKVLRLTNLKSMVAVPKRLRHLSALKLSRIWQGSHIDPLTKVERKISKLQFTGDPNLPTERNGFFMYIFHFPEGSPRASTWGSSFRDSREMMNFVEHKIPCTIKPSMKVKIIGGRYISVFNLHMTLPEGSKGCYAFPMYDQNFQRYLGLWNTPNPADNETPFAVIRRVSDEGSEKFRTERVMDFSELQLTIARFRLRFRKIADAACTLPTSEQD